MSLLSTALSVGSQQNLLAALADASSQNEINTLLAYVNRLYTTDFTAGVGTASATGNVASERLAVVNRTLLTLTAVSIAMVDAAQGGGTKIYTFPEGRVLILGATGTMTFTTTTALASTINASVTGNWGVGSTVQANGTLATTEQNIIPTKNFTSSAIINVAGSTTSQPLAASLQLDGTATAIAAYLNVGIAGATDIDGDGTLTATGTLNLTWILLGDY